MAAPKPKVEATTVADTSSSKSTKPVFKIKLQDMEVVSMSAAKFEVQVEGID